MSVSILTTDVPALSASSSTASSSASSVSSIPARRIRFAPLPDPRALDDADDDYAVDDEDPMHIAAATCLPESKPCSLSSSPSSVASDHSPTSPKPTTQQLLSHPPIPHAPSWSKPKSLNLLRPFPFRRNKPSASSASSHSLTPTQSLDSNSHGSPTPTNATPPSSFSRKNFSTEEILTLGTINLFRTSSRSKGASSDNGDSSSGWGFGLTRWSSAGSDTKSGTPLSRSQSAQAYIPSISSKLKLGSSKSDKAKPRPSSVISTQSAPIATDHAAKRASLPAVRKGTRMLNGRVYGGPKRNRDPNANPFANARDEDPKFVEWGYGGMGSVRGGRHAGVTGGGEDDKDRTRWERVQSDSTFMGASGGEKKGVGGVVEEEDDGSGIGWVKRRKEQREREKKEKEEKEKAEKEKAEAGTAPAEEVATTETPAASVEPPPESAPTPKFLSISVPPLTDDVLPSSSASAVVSEEATPIPASLSAPVPVLEHHLSAVTIPAPLSRHHSYTHGHRRMASRTTSVEAVPNTPATAPLPVREEGFSESESESESEKRPDDYEDDDDEDEDEEDEGAVIRRKTALGAGVEKISRHN
ncbi:hypothetical protein FPV67DRAFT_290042 [Lyophyllum atratum]|nr:hypothetical protein FPV67DRAFT_290042 [Lyophyllum atratum]